jgi:predicted restriction endonuclease
MASTVCARLRPLPARKTTFVCRYLRSESLQHLGDHGRGRDLDKDDVIKTDAVERVQQRQAALDLVGLDHAFKDIFDSHVLTGAGKVVRDGEDGAQVV